MSDIAAANVLPDLESGYSVVYLDLFGFSSMISNADTIKKEGGHPELERRPVIFFQVIKRLIQNNPLSYLLSDSFVFCFKSKDFKKNAKTLALVMLNFWQAGFLFSGGISAGFMSADGDNILLGLPLVEAVRAQEEMRVPLVAVTDKAKKAEWLSPFLFWIGQCAYFDYIGFVLKFSGYDISVISQNVKDLLQDTKLDELDYTVLLKLSFFLNQFVRKSKEADKGLTKYQKTINDLLSGTAL